MLPDLEGQQSAAPAQENLILREERSTLVVLDPGKPTCWEAQVLPELEASFWDVGGQFA